MKRFAVLALAALACGGGEATPGSDSSTADTAAAFQGELTMPEAPSAGRGRLAVRSAGELDLAGEWDVRAGRCVEPPMLQVLLEQQYDGVILLLALPRDGNRVLTYPVVTIPEGVPEGPASQAGVQRIIDGRPYAWQAEQGSVEVYAWDADRVSGRFALTMRNIASNERSMMAGSFLGVETVELGLEQCQPTGAAPAN